VSGAGVASTAATTTTGVGSAAITASAGTLAASNYDFTNLVNGTLTINQRPLTVTADPKTKTYGDINPALTYTVAADGVGTSRGLVNGDTLSGSLSTSATQTNGVGSYSIDASTLSNGNYLVTANNGTLTINKAHLTVTANNANKTYGDANPVLGTTLSGFVNGESLATSGVSGAGVASTTATTTTGAGTVAITASVGTLTATNYDFTNLVNGTLTINQRPLTVTADPKTKTYGDVNPALSYIVAADGVGTSRGLVNGDTLSGSLSTSATQTSGVGSYTIDASALSNGNYLVTANNGTLTISQRLLTVSASPKTKTYGDINPALTYTVSADGVGTSRGLVNGDTLSGSLSTSATQTSGVGNYIIDASALSNGNYLVTANNGTLTINKANLTVTANNASKTYGDANPVLGTTLSGFVNGQDLATSGVSGAGVASTTAMTTTGAGTAAITASAGTLTASNYDFTNLVNGTLTISQRPVTVTADPKTKTYGDVNPALSYSVSAAGVGTSRGLVNGDTLNGSLSTAATQASGVGSYTIDASALSNGNYLVTANNGTLTINKAHLTVTANNVNKTYGDANPVLGTTVSGFVNGENLATSGVSGAGTATTTANATTGAGTAAITSSVGTLTATNYDFTNLVNGTLTINQRPLTVTADPKTKTFGDVNPALTYTVAADGIGTSRGLVNGDTLSGSLSTTATQASGVGSYTIDASALSNGNYFVTANNGTLSISSAQKSSPLPFKEMPQTIVAPKSLLDDKRNVQFLQKSSTALKFSTVEAGVKLPPDALDLAE
jgi:hypothetical protein